MKDATRVSKDGSNRHWGPLLKLARQIAAELDGEDRAPSTIYAVARGWVKSATVSQALKQAEKHPTYRRWLQRHVEEAQKQAEKRGGN